MRIMVTGAAGYIGSHAARLFAEGGHDVWAYDNLSRGHASSAPGRLVVGDLADTARLEGLLRDRRIDSVVHFAGLTYVGESVREPLTYYNANFCGTLSLLEAMSRCGVRRIVFSSTAAVYGTPGRVPITEDDPTAPINPYGRSKLAVEWLLADQAATSGLGYAALRYFNAAGAAPEGGLGEDHSPETHLIPLALQVALGLRPHLDLFGDDYPTPDGSCVRDYVHVDDLASAHLLALGRIEPGSGRAYNLGTGRGYSVKEVVAACEEVTGVRIPLRVQPRRAGDPAQLVACPDRARRELGWRPAYTDLRSVVETAWNWHRVRHGGMELAAKM